MMAAIPATIAAIPAPMHSCGQMPSMMLTAVHRAIAAASRLRHQPRMRDPQLPGFGSLIAGPVSGDAADLGQKTVVQAALGAVQDEVLLVIREPLRQAHEEQLAHQVGLQ